MYDFAGFYGKPVDEFLISCLNRAFMCQVLIPERRLAEKLLYQSYTVLGISCYIVARLLFPLARLLPSRLSYGLAERLGLYSEGTFTQQQNRKTVWLHAASVGEVQAAIILVSTLAGKSSGYRFVVTTMTEQGQKVARKQFPGDVVCLMAPLDTTVTVRRAIRAINPDLYLCLETEIWPVTLTELKKKQVRSILLNGRISERSFGRYLKMKRFVAPLLDGFDAAGVISKADAERYAALGMAPERIKVCGNAKYDMQIPPRQKVSRRYVELLGLGDDKVFVCGSTRSGEEEKLLSVVRELRKNRPLTWIIAPRHLHRIGSICEMLERSGEVFSLYSRCKIGELATQTIVIDVMGELADLYSCADVAFCGGSLVDCGGHNIMEAARWGLPVYFGPFMKDYRDAVSLLVASGGGFQVSGVEELTQRISSHLGDAEVYEVICMAAASVSRAQQGAARRQVALIASSWAN